MPTKISELTAASALTGAELVPVVQSSTTKRSTVSAWLTYIAASLTSLVGTITFTTPSSGNAIKVNGRSSDNLGRIVFLDNAGAVTQGFMSCTSSQFLYTAFVAGAMHSFTTAGGEQVRIADTTGATRYVTLTGSAAGNPTLGVSGGSLAISAAVVGASALLSTSAVGGVGYTGGAGGTVTQGTDKSTTVALNVLTGTIVMNAAALNAATIVSFTFTNTSIAATDVMVLNHVTTGTKGAYTLNADCGAGSATMTVRNNTAGNLSEAIVIRFAVIKGAVT